MHHFSFLPLYTEHARDRTWRDIKLLRQACGVSHECEDEETLASLCSVSSE